ncbi:hypothetical protein LINGRAPRIM_LOCUS919, partial [Linum grandiflorum]
ILDQNLILESTTSPDGLLAKDRKQLLPRTTTLSPITGLDRWEGLSQWPALGWETSHCQVHLVVYLCFLLCSMFSFMVSLMLLYMELHLVSLMGSITSMVGMPIGSLRQAVEPIRLTML